MLIEGWRGERIFAVEAIMKQEQFKVIGKFLAGKRKEAGFSQSDVAKHLGYTAQFVSNWERGQALPPMQALRKLIDLIKMDREEVISLLISEHRKHYVSELTEAATADAPQSSVNAAPSPGYQATASEPYRTA
ncbi:MAG: hypothetical protein CL675_07340 [Bdellovibrionaceae bacterium]|nr:hypothetical protein [Pseudobdellovibrionaceae bacterium]